MYIFIVNSVAGNGRGKKIFNKIEASELYRNLVSTCYITQYEGHAEEIARQVTSENLVNLKALIVIGGDGTIHEVLNGLQELSVPIVFIPGGSGNDFARGISVKPSPLKILEKVINDPISTSYWLGNYKLNEEQDRRFVNSIGFGFDAEVAKKANRSPYKKVLNFLRIGTVSYVIAIIHVLLQFKPFTLNLEVDGRQRIINNCLMVTIANHPYYGGGMKIIPDARIQPNSFPVLVVQGISKWKILALFLTVFFGKHIHLKEVELLEATEVHISTDEMIGYQVDGQTGSCHSCTISKVLPPIRIIGN